MNRKSINFNDKKIKKSDFYKKFYKAFLIDNVDADNILVSKKEPYGNKDSLKYFIRYKDNDIIRPICIKLLQMTGYFKKYNENLAMSFRVRDKQLLMNYNSLWEKIEKLMGVDFESMPVYGDDDKYIKTKIKTYENNITTNFH